MSRQSEIRRLEDLVAAVRAGRSRSLVVVGPAGIGKSWLCRRASELAEGFTVVRTRGLRERGASRLQRLFDVLSPLLAGRLDRLLAARADALRARCGSRSAGASIPFAVAVASLDLLAMAAEDAPVLVVVDDAPWVDAASLEALRFAARRLDADRVGLLFAARSELAAPLVDAGFESLAVGGLDTAEAVELVHEFAASPVEDSVALQLAGRSRASAVVARGGARALAGAAGGRRAADRPVSLAGGRAAGFARLALGLSPHGALCARGVQRRRACAGAGHATGR